ncbi:MAG: isoprenylcysteine carboxylmethyltransferase family protein [Mangrovicoccus sp.]|nr:isoprenylcysteine carboxylmethyltransferase family protein [Mangrovicoccus sp.]
MNKDKVTSWLKWLDLPPIWLAVFLALAWVQAHRLPVPLPGNGITDLLGGLLVGGGVVLMAMAVMQMRQARTTVIPHQTPQTLVDGGIFSRSRNPIYLGDVMVLAGLMLFWEAWPALILVPLFIWLITDRFILPEEERLQETFGSRFDAYAAKTRRWL